MDDRGNRQLLLYNGKLTYRPQKIGQAADMIHMAVGNKHSPCFEQIKAHEMGGIRTGLPRI